MKNLLRMWVESWACTLCTCTLSLSNRLVDGFVLLELVVKLEPGILLLELKVKVEAVFDWGCDCNSNSDFDPDNGMGKRFCKSVL